MRFLGLVARLCATRISHEARVPEGSSTTFRNPVVVRMLRHCNRKPVPPSETDLEDVVAQLEFSFPKVWKPL
jgi:hypothetical protein